MRTYTRYAVLAIMFIITIASCNRGKNIMSKLEEWDSMINENPALVRDSLEQIKGYTMNNAQQAYHSLLLTIARDKSYFDFENDKRISRVVRYYEGKSANNDNHVRALIYQGIVRYRVGISDSSVYIPLRKAETIFRSMKKHNPEIGYMLNYFLGDVYFNNNNTSDSDKHLKRALEYANLEKNDEHIIDAQLALFWNYVYISDMENARIYLDSISKSRLDNYKVFYILNAKSYFYRQIGDNEQSLEYDKKQLNIHESTNNVGDLSKLYYSISTKYASLSMPDSALYYAEKALDANKNISKHESFLFYKNLADIADMQNNHKLAKEYMDIALNAYRGSVDQILNNEIKEAERKYDLSVAENRLLRSRQTAIFWAMATMLVILVLLIVVIINRRIRTKSKEKLMILRHEAEQQELKTKLMEEDAIKMEWMISIYSYLSERLTNLQDSFTTLSQKYVSAKPMVHKEMNSILLNTSSELRDMYNEIHPDDITFTQYTNLTAEEASIFNPNEKMMIMLLSNKASNKQIATFMNSTIESVRARKSQLKKKMINAGINTDRFF